MEEIQTKTISNGSWLKSPTLGDARVYKKAIMSIGMWEGSRMEEH